jgi:acetyl esterase/lipase
LQVNADGSVDVYFGPKAPAGKESNWVQTVPAKAGAPCFDCMALCSRGSTDMAARRNRAAVLRASSGLLHPGDQRRNRRARQQGHPAGAVRHVLGKKSSRTDPLANPLKADSKGFPRLYVNAGAVEPLLDNAQDLAHIAKVDGVDITLSIVDGMQHVFPFLAGRAAAADEELRRIAKWFKGA